MIKIRNLLTESSNRDYNALISDIKAGKIVKHPFWRGMSKKLPNDVNRIKPRTDRKPLSSSPLANDVMLYAAKLKHKDAPDRTRSVFISNDDMLARSYGTPWVVLFPTKNSKLFIYETSDSYGNTSIFHSINAALNDSNKELKEFIIAHSKEISNGNKNLELYIDLLKKKLSTDKIDIKNLYKLIMNFDKKDEDVFKKNCFNALKKAGEAGDLDWNLKLYGLSYLKMVNIYLSSFVYAKHDIMAYLDGYKVITGDEVLNNTKAMSQKEIALYCDYYYAINRTVYEQEIEKLLK